MIKAVATALVLIAGAAVVLWFGNMLNSWILGGLIGGLAALLLSIPISLTLFSYLSRHHDERQRAEVAWTEATFSQRAIRSSYEMEDYAEPVEAEEEYWDEDAQEYYQQPRQQMRNLPLPAPQRLPAQLPAPNGAPASRRGNYGPLPKPGTRNMPTTRGRDGSSRRATTRHMNKPGGPGYETGSALSQQRSAALRAARREKLQQQEDDIEVLPTHFSRPIPSVRPEHDSTNQYQQPPRPRASRQLPPETTQPQRHPRIVEAKPSRHDLSRSLPLEDDDSLYQSSNADDPETENLRNLASETGPMQRTSRQFVRNPRLDGFQPTENSADTLGRPLVRRAPYTYEDDPIRQKLSQHLHPPRIRRSSRLEQDRE